jgi:hypothetical protein
MRGAGMMMPKIFPDGLSKPHQRALAELEHRHGLADAIIGGGEKPLLWVDFHAGERSYMYRVDADGSIADVTDTLIEGPES